MPLQATSGAASYDAFGGGVPAVPNYIEDVFATHLYTGNGSTQTITNNIDLSTKGGMVWAKRRDSAINHGLWSSTSSGNFLISNATTANTALATGVTAFNTNGFSLGSGYFNTNAGTYVSWSFKQQPKFFAQVTYTGTGSATTISHDLGSIPAFIIVKRTDTTSNWACYHTSLGATQNIALNAIAAAASSNYWNNTSPTSTVFSVDGSSDVNASGGTYIAYLFASNAGGFGLTGTDNVISCGSYTGNGSATGPVITLGYEPQWLMIKNTSGNSNWSIFDNMRGFSVTSDKWLQANTSGAEADITPPWASPSATGFYITDSNGQVNNSGNTYIYIAIRRGPMKVPTSGTSVFSPIASSSNTSTAQTTNFPVDLQIMSLTNAVENKYVADRLRGVITTPTNATSLQLRTNSTANELTGGSDFTRYWNNNGFETPSWFGDNYAINGYSGVFWNFRRAPGFFDEVCYDSNGVAGTQIPHNLGVKPQLMIVKCRNNAVRWVVYAEPLGATQYLVLNLDFPASTNIDPWNNTEPTASVFTVEDGTQSNAGYGYTYVAYLFATCAGVQYINSYVGDGTTGRTINCGFTGGARFVCIKATSTSGSWWTFDSARGIVTNSDPALQLNSTAAEVTSADAIDTASSGFIVNQEATCSLNASGVSYLVWAIA